MGRNAIDSHDQGTASPLHAAVTNLESFGDLLVRAGAFPAETASIPLDRALRVRAETQKAHKAL